MSLKEEAIAACAMCVYSCIEFVTHMCTVRDSYMIVMERVTNSSDKLVARYKLE